jgi:dephospho-CoA kinase
MTGRTDRPARPRQATGKGYPLRVGLTGPLAAGKSEVLKHIAARGIPVFSADEAVRSLYAPGGRAVAPVSERFPGVLDEHGGISRHRLAEILAADPSSLAELEAIVHPLVTQEREAFFRNVAQEGHPLAVAEIPLLFETGAERDLDVTVAVVAPSEFRHRRALARPGMNPQKLRLLEARHLPAEEKSDRADYVLVNDGTLEDLRTKTDRLITYLQQRAKD